MEFLLLNQIPNESSDTERRCWFRCNNRCVVNLDDDVDAEKDDMVIDLFSPCRIDMACPNNFIIK